MKKFLAIYHSAPEAMEQMANATKEQKEAGMAAWMDWKAKSGGAIVDFGAPLMGGTAIDASGGKSQSKKEVSGYSVVQAQDVAQAHALFNNHPHLSWHASATIEIHDFVEM